MKTIISKLMNWLLSLDDSFQSITVSEALLWWINLLWAVWFIIFDIRIGSPVFQDTKIDLWVILFLAVASLHLFGVLNKLFRVRVLVGYFYSMQWLIWLILTVRAKHESPIVPITFCLAVTAIILSARLTRESKAEEKAIIKIA